MAYIMERSSPLAAMQAPSLPFNAFGCRGQSQSAYAELNYGQNTFNFKDLSMTRAPMDYFSLKSIRGSSPTASLAADLSQNMHIDQSPQLPTPRRSLFSSNLFGTITGRETLSTPPPPSSSPGPCMESMEISPLPHKAPFVVEKRVDPTPEEAIIDADNEPMSLDPTLDAPMEVQNPPLLQERRRPTLLRPSLSRTKGFSTSAVSLKPAHVECPPFKFGNGASSADPLSPKDYFTGSPLRNGRPQSADSPSSQPMGPPRFRQPFSNLNSHLRSNAAPAVGHVRKQSNPLQRPRKQFRRSLSMFEHPGDVMKDEKVAFASTGLDTVMDLDDTPKMQLPHFNKDDESIPRISKDTMADILDGKYGQCYDRSLVVDCRFEYEYEGGHIDGAVNYNGKDELSNELFKATSDGNTLLIFHCEYSVHRAPMMAKHVRNRDRACNAHRYPNLTYPEIYILDGGYCSFFDDHKFRCSPPSYVPMGAQEHEAACERGLGKIKQGRAKLSRAQTFAFGQQEASLDDSPTAPGRRIKALSSGMDIAFEDRTEMTRLASRRMVSF